MPRLSHIVTSLLEIQAVIGDVDCELTSEAKCDIPLPDADGMGIVIIDTPSGTNGHDNGMQDPFNSRS